ncbi:hypothetical protein LTR62_008277 [Meristemomyces frigidus]|uniref:Uncharacterized protein n=1 Tax=Meristemomyces frigidus TaxID=1508187 RepID=A0AAN7TL04_9PEZI|nr:hypothetical protein LTR62_008277 [Meristemomyces frigidus]
MDAQMLEGADDWVLVNDVELQSTIPTPNATLAHNIAAPEDGPAPLSLDDLRGIRSRATDERQLLKRECNILVRNLDELVDRLALDDCSASHSRTKRYQENELLPQISTIVRRITTVDATERDVMRLEQHWAEEKADYPADISRRPGNWARYTATPEEQTVLLSEYIMRAGDASIAGERLAEWDVEQQYSPDDDRASIMAEKHRKTLVRDWEEASHDAMILEAKCLSMGLDPSSARYRQDCADMPSGV